MQRRRRRRRRRWVGGGGGVCVCGGGEWVATGVAMGRHQLGGGQGSSGGPGDLARACEDGCSREGVGSRRGNQVLEQGGRRHRTCAGGWCWKGSAYVGVALAHVVFGGCRAGLHNTCIWALSRTFVRVLYVTYGRYGDGAAGAVSLTAPA
jgi:hypothetical protein